jgi:lamin tail-like protein/Big-like domain-containing protein
VRLVLAAAVLSACAGSAPPEIHDLADQVAIVGQELDVEIDGTDADGDKLTYGVHADISLQGKAMITKQPDGKGLFRWTPLADDIGEHAFDFTASDGDSTTTVSITIDVRSAVGAVPVFRQPLGTGTVVDLAQNPCVDLSIVIDDMDSASVTIAQDDPVIDGAQLMIVDGLDATWHWCPTPAQVSAQSRYTLVLSADDGDNPKTIKDYVLVISGTAQPAKLVINEVDYDQAGTDIAEFVEILNTSSTTAQLAGLQLVLVNGATNMVYDTIDLSSVGSLAGGQYLVISGPNVTPAGGALHLDPVWTQDQIQNGAPDGMALIDSVTHTVLDALSYEGSITAAMLPDFAAPVSLVEGSPTAAVDANTGTLSLCRIPDGSDTDDAAANWATCATLTPGAANTQ